MANQLSIRDRELLNTNNDRIIGQRPYEAGKFKDQGDKDFILFELLDTSGRVILHKSLSSAVALDYNDTYLGLFPAQDIKDAGFKSGTFRVRYQFLRRLAGNDSSVLLHTQSPNEGIIYPQTNDFHITDDGKVYIGTEAEYNSSDGQQEQLRVESLTYQIDSISPSRTEVRLKAKNIKSSNDLGGRGAYQNDFFQLQEKNRNIFISADAEDADSIGFIIDGTNGNLDQSRLIMVNSSAFMVATDGGFNSSMVGGTLVINNVFKVQERVTRQRTGINIVENPSFESLRYDEDGNTLIGEGVEPNWDLDLHYNAVYPENWTRGYFSMTGGGWDVNAHGGTAGEGYHAHFVQGEGVDGGVAMKFPDVNEGLVPESPAPSGNVTVGYHRYLRIDSFNLTTLLSQNIVAGDEINIRLQVKSSILGKGIFPSVRYANRLPDEQAPTSKLIMDVEAVINDPGIPPPSSDPPEDPPLGFVENTSDNAADYESIPDDDSRDFYPMGVGEGTLSNATDMIDGVEIGIGGTGHWKVTDVSVGGYDPDWDLLTWGPNLHHSIHNGEYNKAGTLSDDGNYEWNGSSWNAVTSTLVGVSLETFAEYQVDVPDEQNPIDAPPGYLAYDQSNIDAYLDGEVDQQPPPGRLVEILDLYDQNLGDDQINLARQLNAIEFASQRYVEWFTLAGEEGANLVRVDDTSGKEYFMLVGRNQVGFWKVVDVQNDTSGANDSEFSIENLEGDVVNFNNQFITWEFNDDAYVNESGILQDPFYNKRGAISEDGNWMWDGAGSWNKVYLAPSYADYVALAKSLDNNNVRRIQNVDENVPVAPNILTPLRVKIPIYQNGVDIIYGPNWDDNIYSVENGGSNYVETFLEGYWDNPPDVDGANFITSDGSGTGLTKFTRFKGVDEAGVVESNRAFKSPQNQWRWDGTQWVGLDSGLGFHERIIRNFQDEEGASIGAMTPTAANEWQMMEAKYVVPETWRTDLPWQLVFYGHVQPQTGTMQGICWVDNIFVDFTRTSQEGYNEIFAPYSSKITEFVGADRVRVATSFEEARNEVYEITDLNELETPAEWTQGPVTAHALGNNNAVGYKNGSLEYVINNPFDLRTYLKSENELFLTTNFKRDDVSVVHYPNSIVYKLYRPLPDRFRRFDEFTIVKEMMKPLEDTVKIVDFIDTDVGDVVLRTPNLENSNYVDKKSTKYETETDILTDDNTISEKLRNEFISQSFQSVEINTDYGQFKNFTNFSSVEKRIRNFKYKLELIESYTASSASLVGISGSSDDLKSWDMEVTKLKNNFDPFEKYMYFESSSYSSGSLGIYYSNSWPKTGGSGTVRSPYVLAHTTSSQAETWFKSQTTSGSEYDINNINKISSHIPQHITDDSENLDYVNFTDMVGQHFDSIWLYANSLTDAFDRRDKLDEGISKELLYTMAKSLGWKIENAKDLVSLPRYAYGVEVTGSSYSDYSATADRDISREIWSRIINNMPFFLKNKGTVKALKGLINVYGIPSTILRVKEYGGPNLPGDASPEFEITRKFTKALDFRGAQYVKTTWTDDNFTSRKPDTVEFRFRAATGSNQILVEKQTTSTDQDWIIRLKDNGSSDDYGTVSFMLSSSAAGTSVGQYKELSSSAMPVYDGDFYSVMVQRTSGSSNPNISQSYQLHVGKYDAGRSKVHLYSKSTMNVDVAASSSFNLAWTGSGDVYIGGRSDITGTGVRFSGSVMEYRHWTETLQTSSFKNHIANPKAYDGNSISSSYKHLTLRYSFDDNQDLSSYAAGILDSRANQQLAFSGSYVGFTGNFYRNVVDELKTHIPSIGALRRTTNKIRIEDNIKFGNLSPDSRVTIGVHDTAPIDSNRVGIYFAPTDVINNDIINSVANLNFDNYLGDPRDLSEFTYRGLDYAADNYWKKYKSPNNFWDYIRILKYYDQSLFKQVKRLIPARAKSRVGVLVEPNIFERPKIRKIKSADAESLYYSSSIDIGRTEKSLIVITGSYNVGESVTHYDAYTARIDMYSYETGSSTITLSGSVSNLEASGSEIRDRFTEGSIWSRLNNGKDMFYGTSSITRGDEKYHEVLQPNITGSRMLGRNQKTRKFFSSAASMSIDNFHSSSHFNVDIDNKVEESTALFDLFYAGVKNTLRTTYDGGSPVEVVITSPTKLVTQKEGGIGLKTGIGKEVKTTKKGKETGVSKFEDSKSGDSKDDSKDSDKGGSSKSGNYGNQGNK